MKKLVVLLTFICAVTFVFAQNTGKDIFSKDSLIWCGLDFSMAKFVGQFDQGSGAAPVSALDLKQKYIPAWNILVVNEPKKFDIKGVFRKSTVIYDIGVTENSNGKINEDNLMSRNEFTFDDPGAVVEKIVGGYSKGENTEGIGLVFIVESISKASVEMSVYVTFFDIASQKVIFTEKVTGEPRGIGIRNYWAGAVYEILLIIEKKHYGIWKKKYAK